MNPIQTATPFNIMKATKFILFKCVPFAVVSLFTTSVFAAEANHCPTTDFIFQQFTSNDKPTYFLEEDPSRGTNWKLTYKDPSYKYTSLYPHLKLVAVQAEMMSGLATEGHMKRVTCIYKTVDPNTGSPTEHIPEITMSIDATATLIMDTNGAVRNKARYTVSSGQIDDPHFWQIISNPDQKFTRSCPKVDGTFDDCNFKWHTSDQANGYWQDGIYRCYDYRECISFKNRMRDIEYRLRMPNPKTLKPGCTELTCKDEIKEMNVVIQELANFLNRCDSQFGCRPDAWRTYWAPTVWKPEWNVKHIADKSEHPKLTSVSGTFKWDFKGNESAAEKDIATSNRAKARFGKLTEFWPDYSSLGYEIFKP
jgi:hypothetical protein